MQVHVTLIPETWIIAPIVMEEQVKRWIEKGWVPEDYVHVDRAFPRNHEGKPILFKLWLEAPLRRACQMRDKNTKIARNWHIVDENGRYVEYIVIPEKPLLYKRAILNERRPSMEVFEYIDSTYTIEFTAVVPNEIAKEWAECLAVSGSIGMLSRTSKGYGKYTVSLKVIG